MSVGWQPIDTAPKDGTLIVCWRSDWPEWQPMRWKTNHRIVAAHNAGEGEGVGYAESYFGDPDEWDDYDCALAENGPTHWHPLHACPITTEAL